MADLATQPRQQQTPVPAQQRRPSMIVRGISPGLAERGKIKIGNKGKLITSKRGNQFQPPQKLDHFLITTLDRGDDGNFNKDKEAHQQLGDQPKRLPVILLYDDPALNFQTRYVAYNGRTLMRSCDGETCEERQQDGSTQNVSCRCYGRGAFDQGVCKPFGTLSVVIQGIGVVGGVWKFRTTSYHTVSSILSSLLLIQRITGGPLAGIPLDIVINPRSVADPNSGQQQTVHVVHLEFRGSMEELQNQGYQIALKREQHNLRIDRIEEQAKLTLTGPDVTDDDVTDEFFPQEAAKADGASYEDGQAAPPLAGADDADDSAQAAGQPAETPPAMAAPGGEDSQPAATTTDAQEPSNEAGQDQAQPQQQAGTATLVDHNDVVVGDYKRIGDLLNALDKQLDGADYDTRTAVWRNNGGVIERLYQNSPKAQQRIDELREKVFATDDGNDDEADPRPRSEPGEQDADAVAPAGDETPAATEQEASDSAGDSPGEPAQEAAAAAGDQASNEDDGEDLF